jgi:outer membrane protein
MNLQIRTVLSVFLILILTASVIYGQSAQSELTDKIATGQLGLADARLLALTKSTTVRKYTLAADEADLAKKAQSYALYPSLSASGSAAYDMSESFRDGASGTAGVSAATTVFDGGKNIALLKKYDFALQAARENLRAQRISVIGSADQAFFAVLEDQASLEAAQSDLDAAKLRLEIAQVKADTGTLSKSDLLQTKSEIASYQATLDKAKAALISAEAKLTSLIGRPVVSGLVPVNFSAYDELIKKLGAMDSGTLSAFISFVVSTARSNSPTYSSYIFAAEEAGQTLSAARTSFLPEVSAALNGKLSAASGEVVPGASVTLSASMDLDAWTLGNSIRQAQNLLDQAQLDTTDQGETLDLDVAQAVYSWLSSAMAIPSCATALEYARTNYENVLEKFKLSSATSSDVSTALALVSTDETALISARYAFLSSLSTLRGLTGLEDDAEIIEAVK